MGTRWTDKDLQKFQHRIVDHTGPVPANRVITIPDTKTAEKYSQKVVKNIPEKLYPPTQPGMITIRGNVPSKSNCYRIITVDGHGSLGKTEALKQYEESFMWQCGKYRNLGVKRPFEFHIDVFYPSKRSDLDNSLKVVMDLLQKVKAISNDNLCCKIIAQKFIDQDNPRIEFKIIEA